MITGTTHTLRLVVADIENPFFARAARGVADVAHEAGYRVRVCSYRLAAVWTHTIKIVVVGTAGHPRFDGDALTVIR
jgi:DNA-binding LacI/PurR family transcriptional regulator